jgi:hypothetical protein
VRRAECCVRRANAEIVFRLARWFSLSIAAICVSFMGCNQGPQFVPVTGKVTFQGKPLAGAEIVFQPASGSPAMGRTDDQGNFSLSTFGDQDGAIVGDYKVTVVKNEPIPGPPGDPYARVRNILPPQYANAQSTPLGASVSKSAEKPYDFDIVP